MLTRTFIHIRGIGTKRECFLWRRGITDWHRAIEADLSFMGKISDEIKAVSLESIKEYEQRHCAFFADNLPGRERWRMWQDFRDECVYLDIETDPFVPTVIGVYKNGEYRNFVRGRNFEDALEYLNGVKFFVTYFGSGFDVPVLRRHFGPELLTDAAHLDLMHVLHSMGIKGGLKASEKILGISRPHEVEGMSGDDAVRLWFEYKYGNMQSLDTLVTYNREDVINLEKILTIIVPELTGKLIEGGSDDKSVQKTVL